VAHGIELFVVATVCIVLAVGAAIRSLRRFIRLPYTVAMLGVGFVAGLVLDPDIAQKLHPSADLIIFVFLPALIFESVLDLDAHKFMENLGGMLLLAVPALMVSTGLTAAAMVGVTAGSWSWSWSAALVFGALISATDPVAVVALLREVGAPKRLGMLIEGESLLNDGTAIVLFGVLVAMLGAPELEVGAGAIVGRFVGVIAGGVLVGLGLAVLLWAWMGRVFFDPLVEITLTVVLAYLAMIVAESVLHVSGVIAIVVAGLWLAGPGRSATGPEVSAFLHRFWSLLAYAANTLIFFLVGVLVACQVPALTGTSLLIAGAAFVVVMTVRAAVVFSSLVPIGKLMEPVSKPEAAVIAWGGLRGAVSLALALIVSHDQRIPEGLRVQILLVTAVIVTLTIVINGTTMGALLRRLGLTVTPPAQRWVQRSAERSILDRLLGRLRTAAADNRGLQFGHVIERVEIRRAIVEDDLKELASKKNDPRPRYWQRALAIERGAYWRAFADGLLGAAATAILDRDVERHRAWIHDAPLDDESVNRPLSASRFAVSRALRRRHTVGTAQLYLLSLEHDLARGQAQAARAVIDGVRELDDPSARTAIDAIVFAYTEQLIAAQSRLEDLRANLPELSRSIERRLGERIALNYERDLLREAARDGRVDHTVAHHRIDAIEADMKRLAVRLHADALPSVVELCAESPLLATLDDDAKLVLTASSDEVVFAPDELIFEQGDAGSSALILARGAVQIFVFEDGQEQTIDILGGGDVLGEVALLTGQARTAGARAITTVVAAEVPRESLLQLMASQPKLAEQVWDEYAQRQLDNHLRGRAGFEHLGHSDRLEWIAGVPHQVLGEGEAPSDVAGRPVFIVTGAVRADGASFRAPSLVAGASDIVATESTRLAVLPPRGSVGTA